VLATLEDELKIYYTNSTEMISKYLTRKPRWAMAFNGKNIKCQIKICTGLSDTGTSIAF
jgi:hypothetical protein